MSNDKDKSNDRTERKKVEKRPEEKKPENTLAKKFEGRKDVRNIVRIVDTDLSGYYTIERALWKIKGLNTRLSKAIAKAFSKNSGIKYNVYLGEIPADKDALLSAIVMNPIKYGIPEHLVNRQKDLYSGENKHVINADLDFTKREDVQRLSKIKARRGLRHIAGLPVRGRKTKSNFRRKGGAVGVEKKK